MAWIEHNIRKVDSATGGRVAYVYVPNTADAGYVSFRRYFPAVGRAGLVRSAAVVLIGVVSVVIAYVKVHSGT